MKLKKLLMVLAMLIIASGFKNTDTTHFEANKQGDEKKDCNCYNIIFV